jgi:NADH-quinone oxidoreductase subunit C
MTTPSMTTPSIDTRGEGRRKTLERVRASLGDVGVRELDERDGEPALECEVADLESVFRAVRAAGFEQNTFVTAIDHDTVEPRFEVFWQFLSYESNDRVRVSVRVPSSDPRVPSCTAHWPGARFSERECFDMFGVRFDGHPDLRRLLMPEEYEHYPLRKDFPHEGIEPDKLYRAWDTARRAAGEGLA